MSILIETQFVLQEQIVEPVQELGSSKQSDKASQDGLLPPLSSKARVRLQDAYRAAIIAKDTAPNQWEIGFLSEFNEILHSCRLGHKEQTFYGSHPPGTPRLTSRGPRRSIIMTFPDL